VSKHPELEDEIGPMTSLPFSAANRRGLITCLKAALKENQLLKEHATMLHDQIQSSYKYDRDYLGYVPIRLPKVSLIPHLKPDPVADRAFSEYMSMLLTHESHLGLPKEVTILADGAILASWSPKQDFMVEFGVDGIVTPTGSYR
jgi:hypothetical protein